MSHGRSFLAVLALLVAGLVAPGSAFGAPSVTITYPPEAAVLEASDWATGKLYLGGTSARFSVTGTGIATTECRFDTRAFGPCDFADKHWIHCLPNGTHTLQVRASDTIGNTTVASRTWTLGGWAANPYCQPPEPEPEPDLSGISSSDGGPAVTLTGGVASGAWSTSRDVSLEFAVAPANLDRVECSLDDGAFGSCTSGASHIATGLDDGVHSVRVRVYDTAGKQTTAGRRFRVDATAPPLRLATRPSEGEVIAAGRLGRPASTRRKAWSASRRRSGTSPPRSAGSTGRRTGRVRPRRRIGYSCLPMGAHTFDVRLTDRAGNVSLASRSFALSGWVENPSCPAAGVRRA